MTASRYVRLTAKATDAVVLSDEVEWLKPFKEKRFFKLPIDFQLNENAWYQSGMIVGMDAASVAAVWALQAITGDVCLDLCCAPGMKLSLISEIAGQANVFGTDVNEQRLDVCFNLLHKMGYSDLCRNIYQIKSSSEGEVVRFEHIRKSRKRRGKKRQKIDTDTESMNPLTQLYDRVLVDTECSHDGSLRHVSKHTEGFWARHSKDQQNRQRYSTALEMEALISLQQKLITTGFERLKPGGVMVYSTCSLQSQQNEEIVEYLLKTFPESARPGRLPFACMNDPIDSQSLPVVPAKRVNEFSCLFHPDISGTSGQFIAVVCKI